jgi:hypothetical protein
VAEVTAVAEPTILAENAGTLYTDGPLAMDSAVFNDEALTDPTADGVYGAEDGRDITVTGGVVTDITDTMDEAEDEAAPADTTTAAITAAVAAAMAPFAKQMEDIEAKVNRTVPPTPRPSARAATGSQVDPKDKGSKPVAKKSVLAGASTTKA